MNSIAEVLFRTIQERSANIGVIGLGYVGLPLALAFAEKGFRVAGFDIDQDKVDSISRGESLIKHLSSERIRKCLLDGNFEASTDFTRLHQFDVLLICVPTPLTSQRDPDMSYIVDTTHKIAATLRRGQLVVLESTTYPGTTDELMLDIFKQQTGLTCGVDYFLAFSPEREDPGNKQFNTMTIPKVVGGVDEISGDIAQKLYDQAIAKTVRVSSARTAEAAKLTENIFRAVNIALVNELKTIYDKMNINIWEVMDAAATKPFGFMRFNPGPGWGGHCIPLDPFYLSWKAREHQVSAKFIELAGEVNVSMPQWCVNKLVSGLNRYGKAPSRSRVLLMGLAYKKDIDDMRESPTLEIANLLAELQVSVEYHDPYIPEAQNNPHCPSLVGKKSVNLNTDIIKDFDAVMIVTDHSSIDYVKIAEHAQLVVDTRGVYQRSDFPKIEGFASRLILA